MTWKLFIDDERTPPTDDWVIARTNEQAVDLVQQRGLPIQISFDHDLGQDDSGPRTTMEFVKWLSTYHFDAGPPKYIVHSQNPVGCDNLISYLEGWRKVHG